MKKLFIVAVLLTAVLTACGSSVSDATRAEASELIRDIKASLSEVLDNLSDAENAQAANAVAENFRAALASFTERDAALTQKSDYFLINTDKKVQVLIDELSAVVQGFTRSIGGESDAYLIAGHAVYAANAISADFRGLSVYPITWLNACAEARSLIEDLATLMDTSFVALRDARDGSTAGATLVAYANGIRELSIRGIELEAKYPEFKQAATDPSLERPVADLRAAMVNLGREINSRSKELERDADFQIGFAQMTDILNSIRR
jgi:hypothetical protein